MLAFIRKYFEESHLFIQLFYGPRLKRKELSELFFNWRKSKNRSLKEKNKIIISGVRSQYSDLFKNWKWIIIQTILWLAGYKYTLAGRAAIYNQLSTIFIIIFASIFLNEYLTKRKWVAIFLALIGSFIVSIY